MNRKVGVREVGADHRCALPGAWLHEGVPPCRPVLNPRKARLNGILCCDLHPDGERDPLWTVHHAVEQGREVLVVPGPVGVAQQFTARSRERAID